MKEIKAKFWIYPKENIVRYKNHWWSFIRKLRKEDYVDKKGYIRRGSSSSLYEPSVRKEGTHYIINPSAVNDFLLRRHYGGCRL